MVVVVVVVIYIFLISRACWPRTPISYTIKVTCMACDCILYAILAIAVIFAESRLAMHFSRSFDFSSEVDKGA